MTRTGPRSAGRRGGAAARRGGARGFCGERDGVLPSGEKNCAFGAKDCAFGSALSVKDGHVRKQCRDLYSRDADTIKASRVGRGWF